MRDDDAPGPLTTGSSAWAPEVGRRGSARLHTAVDAIRFRFGDQALLLGSRLPAVSGWASGFEPVDRLSGIGGLPRGRLTLLAGLGTCGKLSLGLDLLARASRDLSQAVVIDPARCFDPSVPALAEADLDRLTLLRPAGADACGEAALTLARAGSGLLLLLLSRQVLEEADAWLPALEGAASRSGTVVVTVVEESRPALAHASSFTLGLERTGWILEAGAPAGLRARVTCRKNRVGAPGATAEIEVLYSRGAPACREAASAPAAAEEVGTWQSAAV